MSLSDDRPIVVECGGKGGGRERIEMNLSDDRPLLFNVVEERAAKEG